MQILSKLSKYAKIINKHYEFTRLWNIFVANIAINKKHRYRFAILLLILTDDEFRMLDIPDTPRHSVFNLSIPLKCLRTLKCPIFYMYYNFNG